MYRNHKWFATLKEARAELKLRKKEFDTTSEIRRWTYTKRKKPYFVGNHLQWINV